jgi:hypothetical protein
MKKFWVLLMTVFALFGFQQIEDKTITGRIVSAEDGSALPGVYVVYKNTTIGTSTDLNGEYQISIPQQTGSIVFSFIGLQTQEILIDTRTVINVAMKQDSAQLSEVVVYAICFQRQKEPLHCDSCRRDKRKVIKRKLNKVN